MLLARAAANAGRLRPERRSSVLGLRGEQPGPWQTSRRALSRLPLDIVMDAMLAIAPMQRVPGDLTPTGLLPSQMGQLAQYGTE
jgi:hypothetical protein